METPKNPRLDPDGMEIMTDAEFAEYIKQPHVAPQFREDIKVYVTMVPWLKELLMGERGPHPEEYALMLKFLLAFMTTDSPEGLLILQRELKEALQWT